MQKLVFCHPCEGDVLEYVPIGYKLSNLLGGIGVGSSSFSLFARSLVRILYNMLSIVKGLHSVRCSLSGFLGTSLITPSLTLLGRRVDCQNSTMKESKLRAIKSQ